MNRRVWRLAWPVVLSNLTIPLVGAVDTAVVGHLDAAFYIGGVALGTLLFNYIYWGFGFLRMGTTGFVAQARGAGDGTEIIATLGRALILALLFGAACILLSVPIEETAFVLLEGSADVEEAARSYFAIRVWAAPAALCNSSILGWLFGMQAMRAGLVQQLLINSANVVLNLYFVLVLDWGIEGVALATVIAQYAGLAVGAVIVWRLIPKDARRPTLRELADAGRLKAMMAVNRDIFLRTLAVLTASAFFMNESAKLGDTVLAANAVFGVFRSFADYGLDGYAHAAEALVGEAIGRRSKSRLRGAVIATTRGAVVLALLIAAVFWFAGGPIIDLITSIEGVRETARIYLPWVAAFPIMAVWSFQLDGIFIGATRGPEMRNSMIFCLILFVAAATPLVAAFGNHGLWAGYSLFLLIRAVTLTLYYPRIERGLGD
ncbi:MATE family efflux transporter [Nisaea sediminum]|uniref:MATE family efflux transporter n=1 Tax=Nisaea sediminum TaxID=2775867 RepID=UPI001866192B|nr:MATE family efflux transporter [Nisaea sediminum]